MSTPQETDQVVTEDQFVQAFLHVLQGAFNISLEGGDWPLYVAASSRDDATMFDMLEAMDLKFERIFARKAFAHQRAQGNGEPDDELFQAARDAADISTELSELCESVATVKHYCDQLGVATTSFTTQDLMLRVAAPASE